MQIAVTNTSLLGLRCAYRYPPRDRVGDSAWAWVRTLTCRHSEPGSRIDIYTDQSKYPMTENSFTRLWTVITVLVAQLKSMFEHINFIKPEAAQLILLEISRILVMYFWTEYWK